MHTEEKMMLLLNDVQDEKRLAYLLGLNVERHRRGISRRVVSMALMGAVVLLLFFLWEMGDFRGY